MDTGNNNGVKKGVSHWLRKALADCNRSVNAIETGSSNPADHSHEVLYAYKYLIYFLLGLLLFSVYICQQLKVGAFYWPAE